MVQASIGVIGGSGLYQMDCLSGVEEVRLETPFGSPSDTIMVGSLGPVRVAFLPRHGRGHRLLPSELPFQANIYAMKLLGVERIIAVSAVGSLREEIRPGDMVIPDQFIDRTRGRISTFFGEGIVAHVGFGDPVCAALGRVLAQCARELGAMVHEGGTYVCMEGPQFSTRAESNLYRSWGADVIGMTNLQEAKLAREAEICFATVATATDYDCWRQGTEEVAIEEVLRILAANVKVAKDIIVAAAGRLTSERGCRCATALRDTIITDPARIPASAREKLWPLVKNYLAGEGGGR